MTEFDPGIARLFDQPQPDSAPKYLVSSILAAIDRRNRQRRHFLSAAAVAGAAAIVAVGAAAVPGMLAALPILSFASITLAVAAVTAIVAAGVMASASLLQSATA